MSKIDELRETYSTAYQTKLDSYDYDEAALNCIAEAERAGIAAVVRALRDEVFGTIDSNGDQWSADGAWDWFNEILGDAGEKVAGGSTREDERSVEQLGATSSHATTSPATDPAPAVCVWRDIPMTSEYLAKCGWRQSNIDHRTTCPSCCKPIKFTEAKP